jgi:uncharacterized protein
MDAEMSSKHYISWQEIDGMVALLADQLQTANIDVVLGVSRSGLIPAVMLSHILGVRPFAVVDIARTTSDDINAQKTEPEFRGSLNLGSLKGKNALIVDDIVGKGLTMRMVQKLVGEQGAIVTSVTLVVNQENLGLENPSDVVDHYACLLNGWVVFPWEGKEPSIAPSH